MITWFHDIEETKLNWQSIVLALEGSISAAVTYTYISAGPVYRYGQSSTTNVILNFIWVHNSKANENP